jgi:hypothetical protein
MSVQDDAVHPRMVSGDLTGVEFPTGVDAFLAAGPAFLTTALRATGALAADNAVEEIVTWREFFGGGMGRKLALDVRYTRPPEELSTALFAKFTREFGDPLREIFSPAMEPEVRFALLSRQPGFPVRVPLCGFGDYSAGHKSGLLITERVAYGEGGIEPIDDKCLDYRIANPLERYQALTRSMAALAGHHCAGRVGAAIEAGFPYDPAAALAQPLIPFDAAHLDGLLDKLEAFAAEAPQLLPATVRDPAFLAAFRPAAAMVLEKEQALRAFLYDQADMAALCHWNMNLDNAWFWRDAAGTLQCGLLDWGGVGQMHLAMAFIGMTCAAECDFLKEHEDALIDLLLAEYHKASGLVLDRERFVLSLKVSIALVGLAWMLDAPSLIRAEIPDLSLLKDRFDPEIRDRFLPRAQLHLMTVFLDTWQRLDLGSAVAGI